ncbi:MAG TPA: hypothetical protein VFK85_09660 [Anaeromyxobacteraceae bacterium]|nr:hypothetical protein [Anaeromyxobacteraceae bacterium]
MRADLAGEPLTASVQDIIDEHADAERRAAGERGAGQADRQRMERRKADEQRTAMRHAGSRREPPPERDPEESTAGESRGVDPRLLVAGAALGVVLAGGIRRVILLGAIGLGAWALYRKVLEPGRDPAAVLQ